MLCPACETCNSCTQIHNGDQTDKLGQGSCPERGFKCAECLDGWFCPPKETPAQPVPCGLGWPCLHCISGWFCELVLTPDPTAIPSEPRPDGGVDGSQGANNMQVPVGELGGQNDQASSHDGVPGINSPTYGNPPNPDQVQIPSKDPLANGEPMANNGSRSGTAPGSHQDPTLGNGQRPEASEIPISSQNPGAVPSKVPLPLPIPGGAPTPSQLSATPAAPNPGDGIAPGSGAIGDDGSAENQSPGPVVMPLPNTENSGVQNNKELIPSGWSNLGCFQDSISRTLLGARPTDFLKGAMSNTLCIQHCSSRGYTIAGTENGQECWCGTAIRDDAVRLPENYCGTPCQDGTGTVCGGSWAVLVYTISQSSHPPEYGLPQGGFEAKLRESGSLKKRSVQQSGSTKPGEANHRIGIREMRERKRRGSSFTINDYAF
ncbi:WSC domain-containing protein [Dactylonectria macrodidyma]|uniref:WSC domain-containing protein n=1 Tax=Dactylonectria macrodidyma TaxID=307937 RepID=A0A9P9JDV8_9HYPO|nr:WSC domain-containing protein [Dactylonectria macrodidyma]